MCMFGGIYGKVPPFRLLDLLSRVLANRRVGPECYDEDR